MNLFLSRYDQRRKDILTGKSDLFFSERCAHRHITLKAQNADTTELLLAEDAVCRYCFAKQHINIGDYGERFELRREPDRKFEFCKEKILPYECSTWLYTGEGVYDEPLNRSIVFFSLTENIFVQKVYAAWCCGYFYRMLCESLDVVNWKSNPEAYMHQIIHLLNSKPRIFLGLGSLKRFGHTTFPIPVETGKVPRLSRDTVKLRSGNDVGLKGVSMPSKPSFMRHFDLMKARAFYEIDGVFISVGDMISFQLLCYKYDCFDLYWILVDILLEDPTLLQRSAFFIGLSKMLIPTPEYQDFISKIFSQSPFKTEDILAKKHLFINAREMAYNFVSCFYKE